MVTRNRWLAWPNLALSLNSMFNNHPLRTKGDSGGATGRMYVFLFFLLVLVASLVASTSCCSSRRHLWCTLDRSSISTRRHFLSSPCPLPTFPPFPPLIPSYHCYVNTALTVYLRVAVSALIACYLPLIMLQPGRTPTQTALPVPGQ
ncbi:hypothetical protein BC629DRAFT_1476225 [Irpex lacteus]|nr:hypothetical protein BC629DRAFT_1476225 [Irpex lacteus]